MAERALSIQQPWAWLIVHGHKDVENRTWHTHVRGPVLIHAGKKFDREGYEWVRMAFPQIDMPHPSSFPRGGIVGRAHLLDCVQDHQSPWFFGPWGFLLVDAEPVELRPCRGQLGFFEVSEAPHG